MKLPEGELAEFVARLRLQISAWEQKATYFASLSLWRDDSYACTSSLYRNAAADLRAIVDPTADRARALDQPEETP